MFESFLERFYFKPSKQDCLQHFLILNEIIIVGTNCIYIEGYNNLTVIYSHGSKGNIYSRKNFLLHIHYDLNCNVIGYDPPGYGKTPGRPSINNWYSSLREIISSLDTPIILWGESLGGAFNSLVYQEFKSKIVLIIHQDSMSCISNLVEHRLPSCLKFLLPIFPDIDVINNYQQLECPLIIVHSPEDETIPYSEALKMKNHLNSIFIQSRGPHVEFPIDIRKKVLDQIRSILL